MEILNKILALLDEQGKSQRSLTQFLGIGENAFSAWKTGKSQSYKKYIYQIAAFFNVTPDYFLGENKKRPAPQLSETDQEALNIFRKLPSEDQEFFLELMKSRFK